jgi:hypothetical protein
LALPAPQASLVPRDRKASSDRPAGKAAPLPDLLALLDRPARLAPRARSDRPAHKAAPMTSSRARLVLAAKQGRKARLEPREGKAQLAQRPIGRCTGISVSITIVRTFRLLE